MKLSMGSWSFAFGPYATEPKPLDEIALRLAGAGFDGIELSGYPPHVTPERYGSASARAELRSLLSGLGLGISGYSSDLGACNPTVPGNGEKYLQAFQRLADLCHELGAPMIRVDTVSAPGSVRNRDYHDCFQRLADVWWPCAEYAQQAGVTMAWEFEPGFIFNKPSEVVAMHKRIGHPAFRILLDTAHAYMCAVAGARQHGKREVLEGGISEMLDLLHGAIGGVHLIDSDGSLLSDDTSTHVPLGQGLIPWPAVTPKLLALPGIEWWCLDLCFYAGAWELVEENLAAARGLLQQAQAHT